MNSSSSSGRAPPPRPPLSPLHQTLGNWRDATRGFDFRNWSVSVSIHRGCSEHDYLVSSSAFQLELYILVDCPRQRRGWTVNQAQAPRHALGPNREGKGLSAMWRDPDQSCGVLISHLVPSRWIQHLYTIQPDEYQALVRVGQEEHYVGRTCCVVRLPYNRAQDTRTRTL